VFVCEGFIELERETQVADDISAREGLDRRRQLEQRWRWKTQTQDFPRDGSKQVTTCCNCMRIQKPIEAGLICITHDITLNSRSGKKENENRKTKLLLNSRRICGNHSGGWSCHKLQVS